MSGSIRQRGQNSWEIRVYSGTDPETGQRRQLSRTVRGSRTQAQRELRSLAAFANVGPSFGARRTLGELLDRWFATNEADWATTTVRSTWSIIDRQLRPKLRHVLVRDLTTVVIDEFYASLRVDGAIEGGPLAPGSVRRIHGILHRALAQAQRWERLPVPILEESEESQASEDQLDSHPLDDFCARRSIEGNPQQTCQSQRQEDQSREHHGTARPGMSECPQSNDESGDHDDPAGPSHLTQQSSVIGQFQAAENVETDRIHQTPAAKDHKGQRQDDQDQLESQRLLHLAPFPVSTSHPSGPARLNQPFCPEGRRCQRGRLVIGRYWRDRCA